jgi:hypothetical protein
MTAIAETYTVVSANRADMENLPPDRVVVYSTRFGDGFKTRGEADAFADKMNYDEDWLYYSLTASEAKAVLERCGTFQLQS